MTRVCFVSLTSAGYFRPDIPAGGGAERQLYLLSQELKDDLDIHFVVGDYGQPRTERRDGVTIHRAYAPNPDASLPVRGVQLLKLASAIRRADADLYVVRAFPRKAVVVGLIVQLLGGRWIYNVSSGPFTERPPRGLDRRLSGFYGWTLRRADAVIAQTDKQRRNLRENYGIDAAVVPNGYPPVDDTRPYEERDALLWVGRLTPEVKRPEVYLALAAAVPEATFRMAALPGDDEGYRREIERRAEELDNVRYLGAVPPDEIHRYYRDAIALVNTSTVEGFPNTYLEAWRYQTPVVALDVDPGEYADFDDYAGFADGSFEDLTTVTRSVVADPAERQRLGEPTHRYFEENLRIDIVAQRYADVLNETI